MRLSDSYLSRSRRWLGEGDRLELLLEEEYDGEGDRLREEPPDVVSPEEGIGISVCVEDCGGSSPAAEVEEEPPRWAYGLGNFQTLKSQFKPTPTAMPPLLTTL